MLFQLIRAGVAGRRGCLSLAIPGCLCAVPSIPSISNSHPRWRDLADAVQAERVKLGYVKRAAFARAAGVNDSTMQVIELRRAGKVSEQMLDRVNHVLGWPDGAWRECLGESPDAGSSDPIRAASDVTLLTELLRRAKQGQRSVG